MRFVAAFLLLLSAAALAAPPYDVALTVTPPASAAAEDSYEAFLNGSSIGPVVPGSNSFPGLLTENGTFTFRVDASNAYGTTAYPEVSVTIGEAPAPGTIGVGVTCYVDGVETPCAAAGVSVTVN